MARQIMREKNKSKQITNISITLIFTEKNYDCARFIIATKFDIPKKETLLTGNKNGVLISVTTVLMFH